MISESDIQQLIQIEGPRFGNLLMRNNSGALPDSTGRIVRYGLGNISKKHNKIIKSSDLIGPTSFIITQEMVGMLIAQFTAIEVKAEGWKRNPNDEKENAQEAFIKLIRSRGGCAGFASSVEQYREIMLTRYGV